MILEADSIDLVHVIQNVGFPLIMEVRKSRFIKCAVYMISTGGGGVLGPLGPRPLAKKESLAFIQSKIGSDPLSSPPPTSTLGDPCSTPRYTMLTKEILKLV